MKSCPYSSHLTTIARRAPVPTDHLERMLKVLWNPPNNTGEHMPLHAFACLDHACQVRLIFLRQPLLDRPSVYHFSISDSTTLYLFVESSTVETHIRTRRSFDWAVIEVVLGDGATVPSHMMTQLVRNHALLCKVSSHSTVLALA